MRVKLVTGDLKYLPEYQSVGAAGADLKARGNWRIEPGEVVKVPLGICLEIPVGFEVQIRPRSGLSVKYGVTLLNTPATIDSDYRGEINAVVYNAGKSAFIVHDGERIAQMVYASVLRAKFKIADSLSETERGDKGFGSTGK